VLSATATKPAVRPNTLAEAVDRVQTGASQDVKLAEFVDRFDLAPTILTFASPAEFSSRNIFTEERQSRRARSPFGCQIPDEA